MLHRRAALVDARVSPSLNAPHNAVVIVAAIFSLFLLVFFFFGDNFAARPPLDSFDQFDGGRFLATRESIGGHRLVQLSTLSAKKKWRNGWERRNNYINDALFHLVVSSFAAFWLHCHVAFFTQKEFGDKGATGHGQMERVKGSMLRRRHVSIAPGAAVLPTHSVDLTATPSFSVVRSQ